MCANDLQRRLNGLPEELYGVIRDFVFVRGPSTCVVVVDSDYKPPATLQVSRATREQFSASYYSNCTFVFAENLTVAFAWVQSLRVHHFDRISRFRIMSTCANALEQAEIKTPRDGRQWRDSSFEDLMGAQAYFPSTLFTGGNPRVPTAARTSVDATAARRKSSTGSAKASARWPVVG